MFSTWKVVASRQPVSPPSVGSSSPTTSWPPARLGIWAVGDVAGKLQFTHAADEMGRIAAGNALSRRPPRRFHPDVAGGRTGPRRTAGAAPTAYRAEV